MWFIMGTVVGIVILGLFWLIKRNNLSLTWYEWVIGIAGFALMLLTVQNFIGSFLEYEPRAAYMFLLVTGLPSLVLLGVAWQLAARRVKKA
ncbi:MULTISPECIES: hypothetical protein [Dehalococcoides]|nr:MULTISPECIES: hypothetical protein [Dehalococcoides]AGG06974.1 putative reductive dehalogenase anchoring protein [Dehalococcoides mccartyi DCMB5]AII61481.1 dehalogenase [Dehalococcoides mccartyi CG5]AIZ97088.1 putative anchoring protein KB1rdhB15 [Dehalococcoides mccartyi]AMU87264.1 reductive dehalogenase anchoring protein [Dehalococcoides mccartyi]AQX73790.1 reductive dehalogenase membrane anchor [Dehalococcoides mccartyi]